MPVLRNGASCAWLVLIFASVINVSLASFPLTSFPLTSVASAEELHEHPTLVNMLEASNALRRQSGKRSQEMSPELCLAAQHHAEYMARTGNFSHSANGGALARANKYGFEGSVRENIGKGHVSVAEVFQSWKNSSGHHDNILSDMKQAGFGYARDNNGTGYWVAVYGG